jgi:hypothetical protein
MRRNSNKLLAIIVVVILVLPCVTFFSSVNTISKVYAQEKTDTVGADKIKAILLRPDGWLAEWREDPDPMQGTNDFIFEARGDNIVVKIKINARNQTCERNVTITSGVVKMDSCYDTNISLFFDPNDHEYPFKGESKNYKFKLKAK